MSYITRDPRFFLEPHEYIPSASERVESLSGYQLRSLSLLTDKIRTLANNPLPHADMHQARSQAETEMLAIKNGLKEIGLTKAYFPQTREVLHEKLHPLCEAMAEFNSKKGHLLKLKDGTKMSDIMKLSVSLY